MNARTLFLLAVVAIAAMAAWQWDWDTSALQAWIGRHKALGAGVYFLFAAASVVALPFSSLPLLPFAVKSYGVVAAALLSAGGWWAGCLLAFEIARFGRRYLERFTSLDAVRRLEDKVPPDVDFGGIVLLRMILPVDIVSYALGLIERLSFRTYALASLVGILPFAFVWSLAGGELAAGRYLGFVLIVLGMAAVVWAVRRRWRGRHGAS